jgi:hypothetical protein
MSRKARDLRPSPAIIVAIVALVAAVAGTAVAGQDASTSALTKSKVKKVAKKQVNKLAPGIANEEITKRAPGLSVASAVTASRLANVTVQREDATVVDNTANGIIVECPAGQQVISGGVITGANDTYITNSVPANAVVGDLNDGETFTAWRGFVVNQTGGSGDHPFTVYAVCAG